MTLDEIIEYMLSSVRKNMIFRSARFFMTFFIGGRTNISVAEKG